MAEETRVRLEGAPHVYTITEITREVKSILEANFDDVWVEGEVSNFRLPRSGHMYFTMKDETSQLRAVMFRHYNQYLKFGLEDGLLIRVKGRITVYEPRGDYQLLVVYAEPKGYGALQLAFEQLKKKLEAEGLFDPARKKPLPMLPQRIGVVTSPTGAAIRDILNVIDRRFSTVEVLVYPAKVQGDGAAEEIAEGIDTLNQLADVDVIIVGRGGGSLEDLWAFNEEIVARSIFASRIPVISAVGHEIDFTIADFACDLRAPTPSAAAELVVGEREQFVKRIETMQGRLRQAIEYAVAAYVHRFQLASRSYAMQRPMERVVQFQQRVDDLLGQLQSSLQHLCDLRQGELEAVAGKLNSLSPLAILARGYSMVWKLPDMVLLKDAASVSIRDRVRVQLHKGAMTCSVEGIEEADDGRN